MQLKKISAHTDSGPYLQLNEDSYEFDLNNNIYMVLDGFGGSGVGDHASRILKENLVKFYTNLSADPDSTFPFFFSSKYLIEGNALVNSMLYSNNLLIQENVKKEVSKRAGASAIIACKSESLLTLASVGNCTAYLFRRGVFKKIFQEDSFIFLSNDDYDSYLKTMPLSAFGLFPDLHYQIKELRIFEDDLIVMMTDGVYARILEEEMRDIIGRSNKEMKSKIKLLFDLANQRGNLDNQTVMFLEF